MKPSAHRAHPDAELREVMTTGMSAPPIEEVTCAPRNAELAAAIISSFSPAAAGAVRKRARTHALSATTRPLTQFFFGSAAGAELRMP